MESVCIQLAQIIYPYLSIVLGLLVSLNKEDFNKSIDLSLKWKELADGLNLNFNRYIMYNNLISTSFNLNHNGWSSVKKRDVKALNKNDESFTKFSSQNNILASDMVNPFDEKEEDSSLIPSIIDSETENKSLWKSEPHESEDNIKMNQTIVVDESNNSSKYTI